MQSRVKSPGGVIPPSEGHPEVVTNFEGIRPLLNFCRLLPMKFM